MVLALTHAISQDLLVESVEKVESVAVNNKTCMNIYFTYHDYSPYS